MAGVRFPLVQAGSVTANGIKFSDVVVSFPLNKLRQGAAWWRSHTVSKCVFPSPGSSTDVSEDWEKDFDLDMTEEEVQMALSKIEASGEVGAVTFTKIQWKRLLIITSVCVILICVFYSLTKCWLWLRIRFF